MCVFNMEMANTLLWSSVRRFSPIETIVNSSRSFSSKNGQDNLENTKGRHAKKEYRENLWPNDVPNGQHHAIPFSKRIDKAIDQYVATL